MYLNSLKITVFYKIHLKFLYFTIHKENSSNQMFLKISRRFCASEIARKLVKSQLWVIEICGSKLLKSQCFKNTYLNLSHFFSFQPTTEAGMEATITYHLDFLSWFLFMANPTNGIRAILTMAQSWPLMPTSSSSPWITAWVYWVSFLPRDIPKALRPGLENLNKIRTKSG